MKLAGSDLVPQAKMFCTATGPLRLAVARQAAGLPQLENYVIEPTRVFDNMYFIGMSSQNAWAITTSEGIILIDTLNSTDEARDIIVPGLKKVGLDPAQIKYIIVGHGHPGQSDHTGGALYLQKTYGAKVVMNPIDAKLVLPAQRPIGRSPRRTSTLSTARRSRSAIRRSRWSTFPATRRGRWASSCRSSCAATPHLGHRRRRDADADARLAPQVRARLQRRRPAAEGRGGAQHARQRPAGRFRSSRRFARTRRPAIRISMDRSGSAAGCRS